MGIDLQTVHKAANTWFLYFHRCIMCGPTIGHASKWLIAHVVMATWAWQVPKGSNTTYVTLCLFVCLCSSLSELTLKMCKLPYLVCKWCVVLFYTQDRWLFWTGLVVTSIIIFLLIYYFVIWQLFLCVCIILCSSCQVNRDLIDQRH